MMTQYEKVAKEKMQKAVGKIDEDLKHIRTGRPSPALLDSVHIEYYGAPTPIPQTANISVENRMLVIRPWEKQILKTLEKAILASDLGLTPVNDGNAIRLNFPPPTGEQKKKLAKMAKDQAEQGKIAIRNIRRDVIKEIKEDQKNGDLPEDDAKRIEGEIQKITDDHILAMDRLYEEKEKEIIEV
jgi:ribosome recycling factor